MKRLLNDLKDVVEKSADATQKRLAELERSTDRQIRAIGSRIEQLTEGIGGEFQNLEESFQRIEMQIRTSAGDGRRQPEGSPPAHSEAREVSIIPL